MPVVKGRIEIHLVAVPVRDGGFAVPHTPGRVRAIGRCPFSALWRDETPYKANEVVTKRVKLDEEKCWGCGLCASTCPEAAIVMVEL